MRYSGCLFRGCLSVCPQVSSTTSREEREFSSRTTFFRGPSLNPYLWKETGGEKHKKKGKKASIPKLMTAQGKSQNNSSSLSTSGMNRHRLDQLLRACRLRSKRKIRAPGDPPNMRKLDSFIDSRPSGLAHSSWDRIIAPRWAEVSFPRVYLIGQEALILGMDLLTACLEDRRARRWDIPKGYLQGRTRANGHLKSPLCLLVVV